MNSFPVSAKNANQLLQAMQKLGIRESDLEESFVRSSGPGGQNVNKVSTCVVLKHKPSGMVVRCQKERSQALNRYGARRVLALKLDALIRGRESAEAQRVAKLKRQKRKRSKRAKDKMLQAKHQHSEKKQTRQRVDRED
ncbi:MAG: peptide chain release factor-like protein [Candidatus Omnitrophica bacterium]|nr:peptide chain release factor-like protein [Candidatus Omnitrophota bacterium]